MEIGLSPLHTHEGLFILANVVDISIRRQIEQAARENEERLRLALHAARRAGVGGSRDQSRRNILLFTATGHMNVSNNMTCGKAIWRLAAIALLALLLAAVPSPSAHAEGGGMEGNSAPAQVSETSASAVVAQTSSAPPHFRFSHLTAADGLSDSAMTSAVQDRQGFMWFGTERGGLNRYDGYEFKVYQHEEGNERSLSRNNVTALLLDRQGTLWVGTGGGLCRYNRDTDDFTCYRPIPGDDTSLCDIVVTALCEDASGAIWVGTEKGLSRLDTQTGKFITCRHDPKNPRSLSSDAIRSVFADPQGGRLWVGTVADGACVLDPETGEFTAYQPDPNVPGSIGGNDVTCFLRDKAGVLWVGTGGGLNRFVPETKTFIHYRHDPKDTNSVSDDYVWALYEDRAGRFWVCTPRGLNFMDRSRGVFTHILAAPGDPPSYCAASVNHVCEDNTGAVWATSHLHGVVRLPSEPEKFQVYRHNPESTNSLRNNIVESIHVDRNNRAWIGTLGGLDYLDGCRPPVKHSIAADTHSIVEDSQGQIWAGAFPQGLFRIQGDTVTRYPHDPNNPNSPATDQIWALATDDLGGLWIAYWIAGAGHFDGKTFTHYTADPANPQRLPFNTIYGIAKDSNGFLWLVGEGGLTRLDPAGAVFTTFLIDPEHPENEINRPLMSVYIDRDSPGEMWVGTLSGLFRFDPASGRFTRRYTKKDGLPSDSVHSIQRDNQGRLWVGTTAGLSRFDPLQGKFRNYDKPDGLPGEKFFVGAAAKASDGRMFFGSTEGLVTFRPDQMEDNPHPPPVVLTDFELFNKPAAIGGAESPLERAINATEELTLTHKQSVFTFKFAALNYTAPEKNRYAYKLEGFDEDWRYTGAKRRYATYTRLAPGSYVFRVKASNNDGVWNEQGTSLRVTILPPWWATWWFRAIATAALLGIGFAGYRWRVRAITRRAAALELEVAQRTRSLSERTEELASTNAELIAAKAAADSARAASETAKEAAEAASRAKSEFLSSMSHELRTPLNAILGYAQILGQQDNLTSRQHQQVDVMHASGEHLLMLISDILDLSRIEARRLELVEAPFRLPQLLEQTIEITQVKADQKNIELQFETDPTLPECVRGDERRVRQILLNLLSNAVKFTQQGSVTLRVKYDQTNGGSLNCEVADTGIGIASDKLEAIFDPFIQLSPDAQGREGVGLGLTITRRLATLMGGVVTVESQPGQGSAFRLSVPLPPATLIEEVAEPAPHQIRGYRGGRKQVLVVDDNPTNVGLLVAILEPLGFEVLTARNGREALRQALERPPDLVLLDLVMPEMDGLETVRQMRQHTELDATRIVGVSATVTGSERKQAFAAACDGFLGKPVQIGELLQTIGRLLQLEWDIAPTDTAAVLAEAVGLTATAVPPPEVIATLRRTAERGEFGELERLLKEQAADAAYAAFCQQMRRLAARYDDEGIAAYLDQLGKAPNENGNK